MVTAKRATQYEVLGEDERQVPKSEYQREMVNLYREEVTVTTCKDDETKFIFPYTSTIWILNDNQDNNQRTLLEVEGKEYETEHRYTLIKARIKGKYTLRKKIK